MTITLRVDKGAPLTIAELDGNFEDLDGRVVTIEGEIITARSIEEVVQVGNSLFVQFTDSTEDGPFTFETHLTFRGEWEPSTNYAVNDMLNAEGVIYIVNFGHHSDLTFDAGANDGEGNDYYIPFISLPELQIPVGGGEGYVLAKASDDDHDVEWRNSAVPEGGTTGQVLVKVSDDDNDVDWTNAPVPPVGTVSSDVFNPTLAFANFYFRCTNAAGCIVYIPEHTEVAFPLGTELTFRQCSSSSVILIGEDSDSTVTLNATAGYEPMTAIEGAVMTAKKVALNEWDVFGLLATETA